MIPEQIATKKTLITIVSLVKSSNSTIHLWHCPACKTPVIEYKGDTIGVKPLFYGDKFDYRSSSEIPIIVQCPNSKCKSKYEFETFVEEF